MHRVTADSSADFTVIRASGELDAYAALDLEAGFADLTKARVVVDLQNVTFLDSTALGVTVRALRLIQESGGAAAVVLPTGPARRIFEITTLDKVLPVAPSREAALELVREAQVKQSG